MPHSPITAGTQVVYQDGIYTVRAADGNVLELAYHTGDFFRLVHASSVLDCPPPATKTAASLPAPAAGQGAGTWHPHEGEMCPRCGDHDVYVHQVVCRVRMRCGECSHLWVRA